MTDLIITRKDTARIIGVSYKTLQNLDARGEIRRTQITERIVGYRESEIKRFLDERTRAA